MNKLASCIVLQHHVIYPSSQGNFTGCVLSKHKIENFHKTKLPHVLSIYFNFGSNLNWTKDTDNLTPSLYDIQLIQQVFTKTLIFSAIAISQNNNWTKNNEMYRHDKKNKNMKLKFFLCSFYVDKKWNNLISRRFKTPKSEKLWKYMHAQISPFRKPVRKLSFKRNRK